MEIKYTPIGIIHSPFEDIQGMPILPTRAIRVAGSVELFPEYAPGLKDLEGFCFARVVFVQPETDHLAHSTCKASYKRHSFSPPRTLAR